MAKYDAHIKYRPDIDGLRAIAVLSVIGFHAFPEWFPGGFVGVDIFFIISGYLISSIIFEQVQEGRFTIGGFYVRRIKRIFPSLIVILIFCLVGGWYILFPHEYKLLGKHIAGGAGFS
ncbi:MAG TPA: acyltransferase, partial [Albitalea sp.]|nr:acyltransferase [Albitalea sp.]